MFAAMGESCYVRSGSVSEEDNRERGYLSVPEKVSEHHGDEA